MDLIEQNKVLHAKGAFNGGSVIHFEKQIKRLILAHDATSLLDYGCGKAIFYQSRSWGVTTALYDPAIERYDRPPVGRFDAVICVDVLEHIPENQIAQTLALLNSYAVKFLFLTFCDRPATKFLPDGRNAHLTVQPEAWWREQVRALQSTIPIYLQNNTTFVDLKPRIT